MRRKTKDNNSWKTVMRPGYFGNKRQEITNRFNQEYGEDNWRIMWEFGGMIFPFFDGNNMSACYFYEDAYHQDSFRRQDLWQDLCNTAKEVYDHEPSNILAGLDYSKQEKDKPVHLQDISIRRVLKRRDWEFSGDELVQIRSHAEKWGKLLSPGKVDFHIPELVYKGEIANITGGRIWYNDKSIEWAYQQAKVLQIRN